MTEDPRMVEWARTGWSKEEENKISDLMKEDKSTRPQAIQKMQRLKKDKKWSPNGL